MERRRRSLIANGENFKEMRTTVRAGERLFPPKEKNWKSLLHNPIHMLLERKWVQEGTGVGADVIKPKLYTIFNVTTYACVLADPFSLEEDIWR